MEIRAFFFDTYAFFEIINKNPNYKAYLENVAVVTTKLNLMELYYGLLVKYGKQEADKYYNFLVEYIIDFNDNIIKTSMEFRAQNRDKNLSYIDCIGYVLALNKNIKFLTGDQQFKNLPNVEFVK